ncbi:MAG TPA: thioredoxin family protein [Ktedonobacterales bacterium]|nr:thioredoxin family protein [Ktedonobacterales bacterium]
MSVTRERFEQGLTYDQYKAQMTRNQERFAANEQQLALDPADLAAFKNLPQPLNVLAIAEDWCGDVINNLPILGRLAAESGKLNLRVFLRDQNTDLIDQYLKDGKFRSIPVFVFFDDQFRELGRFIERPNSVTERSAQRRLEMYARHPEFGSPEASITELPEEIRNALAEETAAWREEIRPLNNQDVVRDLRQIVEKVTA